MRVGAGEGRLGKRAPGGQRHKRLLPSFSHIDMCGFEEKRPHFGVSDGKRGYSSLQ